MPRHRRNNTLDGTAMAADELNIMAGLLGKTYRRFRRRLFPGLLKQKMIALMLELMWSISPVNELECGENFLRARGDVGTFDDCFKDLNLRNPSRCMLMPRNDNDDDDNDDKEEGRVAVITLIVFGKPGMKSTPRISNPK